MLRSLRIPRSAIGRASRQHGAFQQRTFIKPTTVRSVDLIQDIYIKELKAYKLPPVKASDSEGHVQKFSVPTTPASPEESNLTKDLQAYEKQEVEVEGQAAGGAAVPEEDWFEEEPEEEHGHGGH
ncbi:MAG: hypothetical protein MMC33_000530 [Icmadophila ericetorum]|nr:hypothetical protein [Icmadophila ericetorum]